MNLTIKPIEFKRSADGATITVWVGESRIADIIRDGYGYRIECEFPAIKEPDSYETESDAIETVKFHWDTFIMKISQKIVPAQTID